MIRWLVCTFVLTIASVALAEPSTYVCTVDQATGFHFDSQANRWVPMGFESKDEYIMRPLNDEDKEGQYGPWLKKQPASSYGFFDGKIPIAACVIDAEPITGSTLCEPRLASVAFDKDSRRFEVVFHGAYVEQAFYLQLRRKDPKGYASVLTDGRRDNAQHPSDLVMQIGKCSTDR